MSVPNYDKHDRTDAHDAARTDAAHEAACERMRTALGSPAGLESAPWRHLHREARKSGWPDNAIDVGREAAATPRGAIYDAADGCGGGGAFFRAMIPGPLRHHMELCFDVLVHGGIRSPSMMIRHVAHMVREAARIHGDSHHGRELQALADLFEQHPADAVDYAREWAATFDQRCGGAR